jgi:UDP-N-acetyl-D-mannosaminuronate dehydrogenase
MEIKEFLNKNNNNKDAVVVQGLGFVGTVMSIVVLNSSKKDYAGIGVDRKESINNGIFSI